MIWKDKSARLPFAVAGVFLLIGSSITSIVMISLENKEAKNVSLSMSTGEIEKMLASLKNDLAICLNYAGLYAMKYAGQHPVTKPNTNSKVATDYNGGSWDNYNDKDGWSVDEMMQFNINWIRNMTRDKMNLYIEGNYIDDAFNNGRYAINVDFIGNWRDIGVRKIYMKLDRQHTKPISFVPDNIRNLFADGKEKYPVYLVFYVSLKIRIKDLRNNEIVGERKINVSSLIPSRLPLLMELTENFEEGINSGNLLNNKLFLIFTLLSEVYTEGRALFQYSGQYENLPNIVDNRWLKYLLNGAILFEEFMFFNSIDPVAAVSLLLNWRDLAATEFPGKDPDALKDEFNAAGTTFSQIFGKPYENMLRTISNDEGEQEYARERIDGAKVEINLVDIARAILYDVQYDYYYYTKDGELYKEKGELPHSFHGGEIEKDGKIYRLGEKPYEVRYDGINNMVTEEIRNKINSIYGVDFILSVSCNMEEAFQPSPPSAAYICGGWSVEKRAVGGYVEKGDVIKNFPYEERWEVVQKRQCSYEENGETKHFKQIRKYTFDFRIDASYANDVKNPFDQTTVELSRTRHDDNLFYASQKFVEEFVKRREIILENLDCKSAEIRYTEAHSPDWIEEEVVYALEEIINEMEEIKTNVKNIKNKDANQIIDETVEQLIDKIEENKGRYIDRERYMENGKYKSCGARVVAEMREWFVNEVENAVENTRDKTKKKIDEELIDKFDNDKDVKIKVSDIKAAKDKMKGIDANNLPAIQFGLTMPLINAKLDWNEEIGFSINQEPNYFEPSESTDTYTFLEKNKCLFGPTGFPILPTPITPWIITINAWYIEIQGSFSRFEVIDTIGEMSPDMLFGESDQAYVRKGGIGGKELMVSDPYNMETIGYTTPISFTIKTGNIAVVPPSFVGDINPTSYPVEYDGPGG